MQAIMAERCLPWFSLHLVLFLSLYLLLESPKLHPTVPKGALSVMFDLKLDVKHFPGRNTPGLPRHSRRRVILPPSLKLKIGLHLLRASITASCLIILAGDVSLNPGPGCMYANQLPRARGFKVAHLNVRSMVNKMDDIRLLIQNKPFDIFTVSETWLTPSILDSEVSLPGYTLVRHDRNKKRGGGTAIFVRDGIPYRHRKDLSDEITETCWVEINRVKCKKQFVCCAYRAPDFCCDSFIDHLNVALAKLPAESEITVLGDFNADFLSKKNDLAHKLKQKLLRFARINDLEQLINTPTRICSQTRTAIDLVFVNNNHRIVESGVIPSAISDHCIVFCTMKSGVPKAPPKTIEYRSYRTYDKTSFVHDLEAIDWNTVEANNDFNSAVETWDHLFSDVANTHAPIKKARIKGVQTPWMTSELRCAMRDRDYHHRKAVQKNSEYHWSMYKKTKAFVNKQVKKCKADYYLELINKNKANSGVLWKTLNDLTSRKSTSPVTCIEADGALYTDSKSIAEVLNNHFSSIGSKLAAKIKSGVNYVWPQSTSSVSVADSISEEGFTFKYVKESFVRKEISRLKTNKAIGLDKISARLLKDSASVSAPILTNLFNRSLLSSTFPSIWKSGKVTALFKSGERCNPSNYRPITILPTVSKILEKVVHSQVYSYLLNKKLLTPRQFGFRPKLSTEVALTNFTDLVLEKMDRRLVTGAVFLDLSKAFDTVDHSILFTKLSKSGLSDPVVDWFKSYLLQRTQVTTVDSSSSSAKSVLVGVPQGSVLGPLLFLIYVNDMPSCAKSCEVSLYADDTVVYYSSSNIRELEDNLNADLKLLCKWFNDNLLTLNIDKCKFVIFGSSRKLNSFSNLLVEINGQPLERKESFKYLGVKLSENMSWSEHINALSTKVCQRLGALRRVKHLLPLHARLTLYNSLILPLFDYSDLVWGDKNNEVLMQHLQILQNNAARTILDQPKHSSATLALEQLSWKPLAERRRLHRCIALYKYLHNYIDFDFMLIRNDLIHSHNTRRHHDLHLPRVRTNWGKQRFAFHAATDWNDLDIAARQAPSLNDFKKFLYC